MRHRGHAMTSGLDPDTASFVWHTPTFATGSMKWTSTVSSRLLVEGGVSFNRERYDTLYQDGIAAERGTPEWYARARKSDNSTSLTWNAGSAQLGNYPDRYNFMGAVSYVTGSHNISSVQDSFGPYDGGTPRTPISTRFTTAGSPLQDVLNTPLDARVSRRQPRDLRAGFLALQPLHLQLRPALRLRKHTSSARSPVRAVRDDPALRDIAFPTWKTFSPAHIARLHCSATARPLCGSGSTVRDGGDPGSRSSITRRR